MNQRQELGRVGEQLAKRHLERNGYHILDTNFRAAGGEIDLITRKDCGLVFVEVRTRRGHGFGTPEESITQAKRSHLVAAAEEYLQSSHNEGVDWRIDLVAVEIDHLGRVVRLDVIENAVEL